MKLRSVIITLIVCFATTVYVNASYDPNELLYSMDTFLIRQMEVFDSVRPPDQPPLVQSYGWDPNLSFPDDPGAGRPGTAPQPEGHPPCHGQLLLAP